MSSFYEERQSDSPVLKHIWRANPEEAGGYMDMPTEDWSITVTTKDNVATHILLDQLFCPNQ